MPLHQYHVVGRKAPTESDPSPQVFRMRLFCKDEVRAKSRFWYFLHQYNKMKRATGEILAVNEIREKNTRTVKNYGITIRYNSRSGTHNMYKEFRDTNLCAAVNSMYQELAGRHRARFASIQVVGTCVVPAGIRATKRYDENSGEAPPAAVKRAHIKEVINSKIKFPLAHRVPRPGSKSLRTTFKVNRPTTFFS
eukprot:CAMPEP_0116916670 /NCGR_PEP_ID=MMETSP0467-20121206/18674_1 /TAXON_ID=283647 /ORGANISM="Mesodinium pulex, Strain SPMC105" /LENGTH=193 /DNA_ID=CAMNT_0004593593 /DNA_START=19 /DNA_END=600 /DNA_ORIENTATION=-